MNKYLSIVLLAWTANAVPITYELAGTISQFSTTPNLATFGIAAGDPFRAVLTYDLSTADLNGGSGNGFYLVSPQSVPLLSLTVHGMVFTSGISSRLEINVMNQPTGDAFGASYYDGGGTGVTPWGATVDAMGCNFSLNLSDSSGAALSSDGLPDALRISDWLDSHFISFRGTLADFDTHYDLKADIASIQRSPDALNVADRSATGALLLMVIVPSMCFLKFRKGQPVWP
jgi:hypothetical protein